MQNDTGDEFLRAMLPWQQLPAEAEAKIRATGLLGPGRSDPLDPEAAALAGWQRMIGGMIGVEQDLARVVDEEFPHLKPQWQHLLLYQHRRLNCLN